MQSDIEIDKALALAIGWKDEPNKMRVSDFWGLQVWIGYWANFGYRDWNVIGPIAARYNAFPIQSSKGTWSACVGDGSNMWVDHIDTPQKSIALAVIGAHRGIKT